MYADINKGKGMTSLIKKMVPAVWRAHAQRLSRKITAVVNQLSSRERVFTRIYKRNVWGGRNGVFCSGDGSVDEAVVGPYVEMVAKLAHEERFLGKKFVDIGCGDFAVGRRLVPLCSSYRGVDIVGPLIDFNSKEYGGENVVFQQMDAVRDLLPPGDVCFLRQVLQHLSNSEILAILRKLDSYRWVFITEHYPSALESEFVPNLDKPHGGDIRAYHGSAVCLTSPPFSLSPECVVEVLSVPGAGLGSSNPGVIKTFLYQPGKGNSQ